MVLHILLAHSGDTLIADSCPSSLDGLRSWIAKNTAVEAAHQILMTARGKQVKLQTLSFEQEIFLYDRRILSSSSSATSTQSPHSDPLAIFTPEAAPDKTTGQDLQGWKDLFKRRRAWTIVVSDGSRENAGKVRKLDQEITVVRRGTAIAVENIKQHVANLRPKYDESKGWTDQLHEDQAFLLRTWKRALDMLASIVVQRELGNCIRGVRAVQQGNIPQSPAQTTLRQFVDEEEVGEAARSGEEMSRGFAKRTSDLRKTFEEIVNESTKIVEDFEESTILTDSDAGDQAERLLEEIEVVARKIGADYEHVLGMTDTPKTVAQVSKTAQLHKTNFIPSLKETNEEINDLLTNTYERKRKTLQSSVQYLQKISAAESEVSLIHHKLVRHDSILDQDSCRKSCVQLCLLP